MSTGKAREGFDLDLRHGQSRENALSEILRGEKTVEVKSDMRCRISGNLFIEFKQKGRPSGIAVTTAQYWAFEYHDDQWIVVPTEKLKQIAAAYYKIRDVAGNRSWVRNGGDFNNYQGVLVPVIALVSNRMSLVTNPLT